MLAILALLTAVTSPQVPANWNDDLVRPPWVTTSWDDDDPLKNAWRPYAAILKKHPGYATKTGLPEKARQLVAELDNGPITEQRLYRAAAVYTVARALEWDFDYDPLASKAYGKLSLAWMKYDKPTVSMEFCRMGFALCSMRMEFDAGDMPQLLVRRHPNDRLVIRGMVGYVRRRPTDPKVITWTLDLAKKLPTLADRRPQDFITVHLAHGANFWKSKSVNDAIGSRDALRKAVKLVPPDFAKRIQAELDVVERYVKRHSTP